MPSRLRSKVGVVSTSDSLDSIATDLELMRSEGAAVKEMEAAAVAWVCLSLSIPFVALKAITDIVDGEHATRSEFESNLHTASSALQQKVELFLQLLAGTKLTDWAAGGPRAAAAEQTVGATVAAPAAVVAAAAAAPRALATPSARSGGAVGGAGGVLGALAVGLLLGVMGGIVAARRGAIAR